MLKLTTRKITAEVKKKTLSAIAKVKKAMVANREMSNISAKLELNRNQAKLILQRLIKGKIIDVVKLDSGVEVASKSLNFPFVSNDLVNGKLKKVHGWGSTSIDVTIIDNIGREIEFTSIVSSTEVEVDFSRATINGIWQLLLEKVG